MTRKFIRLKDVLGAAEVLRGESAHGRNTPTRRGKVALWDAVETLDHCNLLRGAPPGGRWDLARELAEDPRMLEVAFLRLSRGRDRIEVRDEFEDLDDSGQVEGLGL